MEEPAVLMSLQTVLSIKIWRINKEPEDKTAYGWWIFGKLLIGFSLKRNKIMLFQIDLLCSLKWNSSPSFPEFHQ